MLSPKELARIDAMQSERDMSQYHFGLGMWMRNTWGLWSGSPLAAHMRKLGFVHPDDMSSVILKTFWCKRHGKDFRLKERAEQYAKYWEDAHRAAEEETKRVGKAKAEMQAMMMGLRFEKTEVPAVRMPDRTDNELRARFLARFGDGVLVAVRRQLKCCDDNDFITEGYYYDKADLRIHKIQVKGVTEVHSAVVASGVAWFSGIAHDKAVLVGIHGKERITLSLPQEGAPPQLGLDGQQLLAVYPKAVYRLSGRKLTCVYSGNISFPRSGPPPELHGSVLYFRDEGTGENEKRLWWLNIANGVQLTSLDRDVNVVGPDGPRWENSFSYSVTAAGDLWVTTGESDARKSLLRRSADGRYVIAIMNNSVRFTPDLFGSAETDQGLSVSAIVALPGGAVLLVGDTGLYRLSGTDLIQELAFANTRQQIPVNHGKNVYHWGWDPSNVIVLDDNSYFISGAFGGIYLLGKNKSGKWSFVSLDEKLGAPLVW